MHYNEGISVYAYKRIMNRMLILFWLSILYFNCLKVPSKKRKEGKKLNQTKQKCKQSQTTMLLTLFFIHLLFSSLPSFIVEKNEVSCGIFNFFRYDMIHLSIPSCKTIFKWRAYIDSNQFEKTIEFSWKISRRKTWKRSKG